MSLKVSVGDTVGPGQDLARSGDSGLSRGPHLHFTVLQGLIGSPTSALGGGEVYEAEVLGMGR